MAWLITFHCYETHLPGHRDGSVERTRPGWGGFLGKYMKKTPKTQTKPEMRKHYDFRNAEVGKYAALYAQGTNIVLLDPDVASRFPDSKSVNETLRSLVRLADRRSSRRSA